MNKNVIIGDFSEEMKPRYLDYAMNVIKDRALPDVRDGLKPVHRRILYDMGHELLLTHDKPYKKSARVVGDVLGKFHPHGDNSVYEAMVRMAQNFSLRYPLIDGHGNWGSQDGDCAAAMRYTEARLQKISNYMLDNIKYDTIDLKPNFDGEEKEPSVLPSRFPNLLVNGAYGIAVGLTTNIPCHNLNEVINGILYQLDNPNCTIQDLIKYIPAPDFPTNCDIINPQDILDLYTNGKGTIIMRASYHIKNTDKNKLIVFTTIPYQVNKSKLMEDIDKLINLKNKILKNIIDIRDESDKEGLRIVIELKQKANENKVLSYLFKKTSLQKNYNAIMCALVNKEPKILNLKQIIQYYIDFQKTIILRKNQFLLNKSKARLHILEGLLIAIDKIDYTIKLIRQSSNKNEAEKKLIDKLKIDGLQAKAILDLKLQRLTNLDVNNIEKEIKELENDIKKINKILNDKNELILELKKDLIKIKSEFGDDRKSKIIYNDTIDDIKQDDLIENYSTYCILTKEGYLKKLLKKSDNINLKDTDSIIYQMYSSNKSVLLLFSNLGNCYKIYQHELQECKPSELGLYLPTLLQLDNNEYITSMTSTLDYNGKLIEIFDNGNIANIDLKSFSTSTKRTKLKNAININSKLIKMIQLNSDENINIIMQSSINKVLITNTKVIPIKLSKNSQGIKIMKPKKDSKVILAENINNININKINDINYYKNETGKGIGVFLKTDDKIKIDE